MPLTHEKIDFIGNEIRKSGKVEIHEYFQKISKNNRELLKENEDLKNEVETLKKQFGN